MASNHTSLTPRALQSLFEIHASHQPPSWLMRQVAPPEPPPAICPITGKPAKYRDPLTRIPYSSTAAFQQCRLRSGLQSTPRGNDEAGFLGAAPSSQKPQKSNSAANAGPQRGRPSKQSQSAAAAAASSSDGASTDNKQPSDDLSTLHLYMASFSEQSGSQANPAGGSQAAPAVQQQQQQAALPAGGCCRDVVALVADVYRQIAAGANGAGNGPAMPSAAPSQRRPAYTFS